MADKTYKKSVVLFRRDLRVHDHTALLEACAQSEAVVSVFVLDTRQTDTEKNSYFSQKSFAFMLQSLVELDAELREHGSALHIVDGVACEVDTIYKDSATK